ncbi:MAG: hypothetical protein JWR80_3872 [Bradyrhizobium sp.]|nr:hypothetical protein [Bradyrhizobium sp.]
MLKGEALSVGKVTWQKVGRVTEPGRYMFTFGWVNISADDLAIWKQFPNASFALVRMLTEDVEDEYHLGAFDPGDPPDNHSHGG